MYVCISVNVRPHKQTVFGTVRTERNILHHFVLFYYTFLVEPNYLNFLSLVFYSVLLLKCNKQTKTNMFIPFYFFALKCYLNDVAIANFSLLLFCSAGSFTALDRNYLTPFFTSQNGDEDDEGKFDCNFYSELCHLC